jgi:hypothetical protein
MGMYGFKRQFVPLIVNGTKHHTIRARRKIEDIPGSIMHLYYDLRQPSCTLIARVPCVKVAGVYIPNRRVIQIDGQWLDYNQRQMIAESDGFTCFEEMSGFFAGRLPFEGKIYHWKPLKGRK